MPQTNRDRSAVRLNRYVPPTGPSAEGRGPGDSGCANLALGARPFVCRAPSHPEASRICTRFSPPSRQGCAAFCDAPAPSARVAPVPDCNGSHSTRTGADVRASDEAIVRQSASHAYPRPLVSCFFAPPVGAAPSPRRSLQQALARAVPRIRLLGTTPNCCRKTYYRLPPGRSQVFPSRRCAAIRAHSRGASSMASARQRCAPSSVCSVSVFSSAECHCESRYACSLACILSMPVGH